MKQVADQRGPIPWLFRDHTGAIISRNQQEYQKSKAQQERISTLTHEVAELREQMKLLLSALNNGKE